MNCFICFDTTSLRAVRMVESAGTLFVMTENQPVVKVENPGLYVYIGQDGGTILSSTVMGLLTYLEYVDDVPAHVGRLKDGLVSYGLRCGVDDIIEPQFVMTEKEADLYTLEIIGYGGRCLFVCDGCEAYCKQIASFVIDYAIALGIDIRVHWKFVHLGDENE